MEIFPLFGAPMTPIVEVAAQPTAARSGAHSTGYLLHTQLSLKFDSTNRCFSPATRWRTMQLR